MSNQETQELSNEDRLKAVLYQFIKLHDNWREDRQEAIKHYAELAELTEQFKSKLTEFDELSRSNVDSLHESFDDFMDRTHKVALQKIREDARLTVSEITKDLEQVISDTKNTLEESQAVVNKNTDSKSVTIWLAAILTAAAIALLTLKMHIPAPRTPLTEDQAYEVTLGHMLALARKKMTHEEFGRINDLAKQTVEEEREKANR